jgi:hypothetical protein
MMTMPVFIEDMIIFFFTASYFFQADLLPVARGERRQSISACIPLHFSLRSTTGDRVLLGVWSLGNVMSVCSNVMFH